MTNIDFAAKRASLKLKCSEGLCSWKHFSRRQSPRLGKTGKISLEGPSGGPVLGYVILASSDQGSSKGTCF